MSEIIATLTPLQLAGCVAAVVLLLVLAGFAFARWYHVRPVKGTAAPALQRRCHPIPHDINDPKLPSGKRHETQAEQLQRIKHAIIVRANGADAYRLLIPRNLLATNEAEIREALADLPLSPKLAVLDVQVHNRGHIQYTVYLGGL